MSKPTTKKGKHGTLYLYEIEYSDQDDPGCPIFVKRSWGYSKDHVAERWMESSSEDPGWKLISIATVPETGVIRSREKIHVE